MSKFEQFLTINGKMPISVSIVYFTIGLILTLMSVPYVNEVMVASAFVLLIAALYDLYVDLKALQANQRPPE